MGDMVAKAQAVRGAMLAELGQEPTPDELAERLGWDPEKVEEALSVTEEPTSLNRPLAAHEDRAELGDLLADPAPDGAPDERAVENMESAQLRETLEKALAKLRPKERATIVRRYGLDGTEPRKLHEIATELDLSRERVRRLQRNAEDALRHTFVPEGS
jgi:RNA polymerase primary sigma factor